MADHRFRDPYADFVLSQLLSPSEAVRLNPAEQSVLLAAVRSEMLVNLEIRAHLMKKVSTILNELKKSRRSFPGHE